MENLIEYTMNRNALQRSELRLGHSVDVSDGGNYLLVPFSLRMLPLILWGIENGYRVISEDFGETDEVNPHMERDKDLPDNVAIGRLDGLRTGQLNRPKAGEADRILPDAVKSYPATEMPKHSGEWTTYSQVDVLKAYYIVEDAEVGEWHVELHPDLFLHEYPNGEYLVLHAQKDKAVQRFLSDKVVEVKGALDSAVDIFVRLQAGSEGFRLEDCDTDIWEDLRSAQVRVAVANVQEDYKAAAVIAARFFDLPTLRLEKELS